MSSDKMDDKIDASPTQEKAGDVAVGDSEDIVYRENDDAFEVFKKGSGVDFRLVGWVKASVIFLKGKHKKFHTP